MTSNAESQDNNNTPSELALTDTYTTDPTQPLTQTSLDNTSLLEYSSISHCEHESSQPISFESVEYNISIQEPTSTIPVPAAINSAKEPCVATDTAAVIHSTTVMSVADAIHSITETGIADDTAAAIQSTAVESLNEGEQNQNIDNSTAVGQEDRIEIFTSGMEDEQEFPNTDGINTKQKVGEQGPSFDTKENGNTEQTAELSDKENKQREINKDKLHSTSHRSSRKLDESSRDKKRGISKHLEHHTHKDLREILTKNSFAANKSREFEDRKIKKTSRSGLDMSISRDRESTQRHRRMYQEIKNTLSSSSSVVISSRDIDPEREWEDKKREREIQRIEVERARRELEARRRQESQSSLHSTNGLKRSLSSYTQDSRPLTIDGGHSEYPIPPVVPPIASDVAATRIARIQNLVRPFTQQQLKSMLDLYGPLIVGTDTPHHYFWTDKNKTQCCCVYQNMESCEKARNALHGARWPSINPKNLNFSFLSIENFNELTGLGITQGILDKTKQEIIIEKQSTPPQRIDKGKEREKVKEKDKVREKEKKDKPREKEKTKEKAKEKEKDKPKEKEKIKDKVIREKNKSKDTEQHKETKEVSKKVKKEKTTNEPIEERSTGPSTEKKQHVTVKKESTHKSKETIQTKIKQTEPTLTVESAPNPSKPIEPSVKVKEEKTKLTEEKPKIKQEKPKSSEKKTPTKRPAPTPPSPAPPQPKKPRESKDTPAVHSNSDMESDNYQCSGQAALLDTLFRKTVAEPCIYWLPLTDEQIKTKLRRKYMEAAKSSESHSRKKRKYTPSPKRKRK